MLFLWGYFMRRYHWSTYALAASYIVNIGTGINIYTQYSILHQVHVNELPDMFASQYFYTYDFMRCDHDAMYRNVTEDVSM